MVAALVAGALTVSPALAQAAALDASLIATRATSTWERPSPDPSGITYDPTTRQLVLSDAEVDELPVFAGTNLFVSSLDGRQAADFPGGNTQPYSSEPAGVSYRPADGHLFVSDDDADRVFEFVAGPDGQHGTPDDVVTSFSTRLVLGNGDAEDVTVDMDVTSNGHVLVVDGVNNEVFDYGPGPNGVFDAVAPQGDDTVVQFDVGRHGALDPEGIEFHPQRNTILVLDGTTEKIYELDRQGALLNTVSIAAAHPLKAAGMTLAPASNGSGAQHFYIVDRGVDNDSDPTENDGRFYEMAIDFPPLPVAPPNVAPSVDAGQDLAVQIPAAAALTGSVTDDGLPNPPATVSLTWSKVSGPGEVTFANPAAASTTATFTAGGTYVLRLTADDSQLIDTDEVTVVVRGRDGSGVLDVPVRAAEDDAEERSDRTLPAGLDLELVQDGTAVQTIGLRFADVWVPQGSVITNAYVQFQADEVQTGPASLTIAGQDADDSAAFTTAAKDVSGRPRTSATVAWEPAAWPTIDARGPEQRTPDLAPVLQQIVSRTGWASGHAITLVVTGTGTRTTDAYEGGAAKAPVLHIEYRVPTPNAAPSVGAGPDVAVVRPGAASLAGTVSDDGLPVGSAVTLTWSQVSGPGSVTFADPAAASTTATFSKAGTYALRLTASDGALSAADDVTVTVTDEATGVVDVRVQSGADDAEERSTGTDLKDGDLQLGQDGSRVQTVGVRFAGVAVPRGARITKAYVQFQADEADTRAARLTIAGHAVDSAPTFGTARGNISSRLRTSASATWQPAVWPSAGSRGADQRTPDLASVVQEIVARPGWASGNAMAFVLTGTGTRTAESFEGGATRAPVLHIEYAGGTGGTGGTGSTGGAVTVTLPVQGGADDAEERSSGIDLKSGDLSLGQDGSRAQTVGLRFTGVAVPPGARISEAYVQFQADEADTGAVSLSIRGQADDNSATFASTARTISSRPLTAAAVEWRPAAWPSVGARGADQRTPDLASVVQEIVARPGWASGNALSFVVTGTGTRTAESFDGGATKAPVLVLRYTL